MANNKFSAQPQPEKTDAEKEKELLAKLSALVYPAIAGAVIAALWSGQATNVTGQGAMFLVGFPIFTFVVLMLLKGFEILFPKPPTPSLSKSS